jgi:uncharacterized membrane protein
MQMKPIARTSERADIWSIVLTLCGIAVAVAIRRLATLANPSVNNASPAAALDALFAAKAALTRGHVIAGLALVMLIPVQLSARVRDRFPSIHRWLGRSLMVVGAVVGLTGYAMVAVPVGGWFEVSAIILYGTAFLAALLVGWRSIRHGDVTRHREWMLRALAIALGIATTRPVVGVFFATRALTGLSPSQFFGAAFWIGFTTTVLAGEWYIRKTRSRRFDAIRPNRGGVQLP